MLMPTRFLRGGPPAAFSAAASAPARTPSPLSALVLSPPLRYAASFGRLLCLRQCADCVIRALPLPVQRWLIRLGHHTSRVIRRVFLPIKRRPSLPKQGGTPCSRGVLRLHVDAERTTLEAPAIPCLYGLFSVVLVVEFQVRLGTNQIDTDDLAVVPEGALNIRLPHARAQSYHLYGVARLACAAIHRNAPMHHRLNASCVTRATLETGS
mmetsp:Transcript_111087/g.313383  ORF Transcript_111087/g.313383 Transcript_111087/m.313383 type:complete len:210 (+) Transcript_111087:1639-2268(+)